MYNTNWRVNLAVYEKSFRAGRLLQWKSSMKEAYKKPPECMYVTHTWQFKHYWSYAGCISCMNLVHGPAHHKRFVAQWLEHLTGVRKVIQVVGLIPDRDSDFFFVLHSWHVDHIISHFLTELKIYHLDLSKEIPYYSQHVFSVTSQYCSSQNDLVLRSSM